MLWVGGCGTAGPEGVPAVGEDLLADCPAAVIRALKARYPGAVFEDCFEQIEVSSSGRRKSYLVTLTTAGDEQVEVEITPKGKILSEE